MADAGGGGIGTVRQEWGVRRSATGNMLRRGKQPGPRSPTGASASFELRACARARETRSAKRRLALAWGETGAGCRPLTAHTLRLVIAHRHAGAKTLFRGMAGAGGGGVGEVR